MPGDFATVHDQSHPSFARIIGAIEVGLPIVSSVIIDDYINLIGIVRTDMDLWNPSTQRKAFDIQGMVLPSGSAIKRMLKPTVIGTNPNLTFALRIGGNAQDGAVVLCLSCVYGQPPRLCLFLLCRIIGCQVWTD